MSDNENQRKGGIERANRLTDEERTEIARAAAQARWGDRIRQATHGGQLIIGDSVLECAVLEDGTRVLSQATVLGALNRASTRGAHRSARTAVEGGHLPPFLSAAVLRPFLTGSLIADLISPIPYRMPRADGSYGTGQVGVAHGYPAEILPNICEVYLKYRDDCLSTGRRPQPGQESAIRAADLLIRGLAAVGIIALVDEATGYQAVRDRHELERILAEYISAGARKWVKTFPDAFFEEMHRLHGWAQSDHGRHPRAAGKLIRDHVYGRLPAGVLAKLEEAAPRNRNGNRARRLHQHLSADTGCRELDRQIDNVTMLMRMAGTPQEFEELFARAFPPPLPREPLKVDVPET